MFINKTGDGLNNVSGKNIAKFRMTLKISQRELADKIIAEGLSVRSLEELTNSEEKYPKAHKQVKTKETSNDYKYLQDELCERLGAKVRIKSNKIEISFVNGNDLNRLLEIMHIEPRG